jgi:predicted nucleic acid-binding protein
MSALVFVDTNVLVYGRDASEPVKQPAAARWLAALWRTRRGRLSTQVLQEYYVMVTMKLKPGMEPDTARQDVRALTAWQPVAVSAGMFDVAWSIQDRYRLSFWDALIVAAAASSDCAYLLSEDLQDGQELDGVCVLNPFRHDPGSYLSG